MIHKIIDVKIGPALNHHWERHWHNQFTLSCIALNGEKIRLVRQVDDLAAKINQAQTGRLEIQEELQEAMRRADAKHAQELRTKQEEFDRERCELQSQLEESKRAKLDAEKTQADQIAAKQNLIDSEVAHRQGLEAEVQRAYLDVSKLEKDLATERAANADLQQAAASAKADLDRARADQEAQRVLNQERVNKLESDKNDCQAQIKYLEQRCSNLTGEAKEHKASADKLDRELATAKNDVATLESQNTDIGQQLEEKQQKHKSLHAEYDKLQHQLDESNARIKSLEEKEEKLNIILRVANSVENGEAGDIFIKEPVLSSNANSTSQTNHHTVPNARGMMMDSASTDDPNQTALSKALTPPKTPRLEQASDITASTPTKSPPRPSPCVRRPQPSLSSKSPSIRPPSPASPSEDSITVSPPRSTALANISDKPLSPEQLGETGRIQKKPGTQMNVPMGSKASNSHKRLCSSGSGSWSSKRPRPNYQ